MTIKKWTRIKTEERNRYVKGRIDLSRCNLRGVQLDHVDLRNAICWQSDFQGASLKHANFEHADLWGANFSHSNLYRAQFSHADAWDVNFSDANINGAELHQVVMGGGNFHKATMLDTQCEQAFLGECNFQEADLRGSNFYRADMREVQFQGANLLEANFCDTNLQRANFHKCSGLQEGRLSGAILSDSTYPEGYGAFRQGLRFLEVTCQSLTKGFILLLLLTGYLLLTLWSTSDAQFLTNSLSPGLPIIRVGVPVTNFVIIFSAILLAGYYYWHLYAENAWKGVVQFPAVFPNGRSLDQELFPWIVNGFIAPNFFHLRKIRSWVGYLQYRLLQLIIWWMIPFSLGLCWMRLLSLHHWQVTIWQGAFLVLAIVGAVFFQQRAACMLRGLSRRKNGEQNEVHLGKGWWKTIVVGVLACGFIVLISDGAINGMPLQKKVLARLDSKQKIERMVQEIAERAQKQGNLTIHRTFVPLTLPFIGMSAFAEVSNLDVSERIGTVSGQKEQRTSVDVVKGAQLSGANLRHLSASHAYLKKANLQGADLQDGTVFSSDLELANLLRANLQRTDLRRANLAFANLFEANLQEALLTHAILRQANLFEANLFKANLVAANLQQSTLVGANLAEAVINGADLSHANMGTVNLSRATLQAATLAEANLFEANLSHTSFYGANLQQVNLKGAILERTNFGGADLSSVINLTQLQLNLACVDSKTKLPRELIPPKPCEPESVL